MSEKVSGNDMAMYKGITAGVATGCAETGPIATACLLVPVVGPLLGIVAIIAAPTVGGLIGGVATGTLLERLEKGSK